jgi:nickel transport protein
MRALVLVLALVLAGPALAHRVNVFASVQGDEVVVEAKFSNGSTPTRGEVRVEDAAGALLATLPLADGTARFPLDRVAAAGGLAITVSTGGDHEGYWLLTPDDIAEGGS